MEYIREMKRQDFRYLLYFYPADEGANLTVLRTPAALLLIPFQNLSGKRDRRRGSRRPESRTGRTAFGI